MQAAQDDVPLPDPKRARQARQTTFAAVLVIVLVGALLRFGASAVARLNVDEGWTYYLCRNPLPDVLSNLQKDRHPPLPYLVTKAMLETGSHDELRLRLPYAAIGVLNVLVAFMLGFRLFGSAAGLGGAGLTAVSFLAWEYDTWMRGYGLLTLLSMITSACWVQVCTGRRTAWAVGYGASGALLLYSHYLGVLALGAQALLSFVPAPAGEWLAPRERLRRLLPCWVFMTVAFVPWLPMLKLQFARRAARGELGSSGDPILALVTAARMLALVSGLDNLPLLLRGPLGAHTFHARVALWVVVSACGGVMLVAGARQIRDRVMPFRLLMALLLPPLLFVAAIGLKTPELTRIRYFAPYIPYVGMLAGAAIAQRPRLFGPLAAVVVLVNVWVFASYLQTPYFRSAAWQEPAAFVAVRQSRARVVVGFGNHMMHAFSYYYGRDDVHYDAHDVDAPTYAYSARYTDEGRLPLYRLWPQEVPTELDARLRGVDDVILILWMDGDGSPVRQWFGERFDVVDMQYVDSLEDDGRSQTLLLHRRSPSLPSAPAASRPAP